MFATGLEETHFTITQRKKTLSFTWKYKCERREEKGKSLMVGHGLAGELNPKTNQNPGLEAMGLGWDLLWGGAVLTSPYCPVWECPVPGQGTEKGEKNFLCQSLLTVERDF